jgi:hypothetical protein
MNEAQTPTAVPEDRKVALETPKVALEPPNATVKRELGAMRVKTTIRCGSIGNQYYAII